MNNFKNILKQIRCFFQKTQRQIDRKFIRNENKYKLPYEKIRNISPEVLSDFIWELDLNDFLWDCCHKNDYEFLKIIIKLNVNININEPNCLGNTPLIYLCAYNYDNLAEILIESGAADVNWQGFSGKRPLRIAKDYDNKNLIKLLEKYGAHE